MPPPTTATSHSTSGMLFDINTHDGGGKTP
jgi:hypothetical protein